MLNQSLIIALKELLDGWRDRRALVSSLMYALMGPVVVGMVSLGVPDPHGLVLPAMAAIFTLVSAFSGGMNIAMDAIAGERERRSLLPLLLNPASRLQIVMGKWIAISAFASASLSLNLAGFGLVLGASPLPLVGATIALLPLALLASAVQLLISTVCRGIKEAQTYLSMVTFVPMGIGMFLVFFERASAWTSFLPITGQQQFLAAVYSARPTSPIQVLVCAILSIGLAWQFLVMAADWLQRDEIILWGLKRPLQGTRRRPPWITPN